MVFKPSNKPDLSQAGNVSEMLSLSYVAMSQKLWFLLFFQSFSSFKSDLWVMKYLNRDFFGDGSLPIVVFLKGSSPRYRVLMHGHVAL